MANQNFVKTAGFCSAGHILSKVLSPLHHCLMHLVKRSGKLATATALLLWQKCFEFCGEAVRQQKIY